MATFGFGTRKSIFSTTFKGKFKNNAKQKSGFMGIDGGNTRSEKEYKEFLESKSGLR